MRLHEPIIERAFEPDEESCLRAIKLLLEESAARRECGGEIDAKEVGSDRGDEATIPER